MPLRVMPVDHHAGMAIEVNTHGRTGLEVPPSRMISDPGRITGQSISDVLRRSVAQLRPFVPLPDGETQYTADGVVCVAVLTEVQAVARYRE